MAIALVGETAAINSASGTTQAVTRTTTAGNCLVMAVHLAAGSSISVSSVTDTASNTWVKAVSAFQTSINSRIEYWTCVNAAAVTSATVTVSASARMRVALSEWSGAATAAVVDVSAGAGAAATTTPASVTVTTTNPGDVVISGITYPATAAPTLGGTFTLLSGGAVATLYGASAYQIETVTGTYGASWTLPSSVGSGAATIALLPATSAPATLVNQDYEAGTNGAGLAVATDGQLTGAAPAGATAVFSQTFAHSGVQSAKLDATAVALTVGHTPGGSAQSAAMRIYVRSPNWPTAFMDLGALVGTGGVNAAKLQLSTAGLVSVTNSVGTGLATATGFAVPKTSWWRVELWVTADTSTTGEIHAALYRTADSVTPDWTYDGTGVNAGTAVISSAKFGKLTTTGNWLTAYVDDFALALGRSSFIGPAGSAISAAPSLTGSGVVGITTSPAVAAGTAALSGSGTVTPAASVAPTAAAALTGSGDLSTPAATVTTATAATLAGSGAVTAAATPSTAMVVTLDGTGTLTAATSPAPVGTGTLSGSGAVTTGTTAAFTSAVSLAGAGTVSAAGTATFAAAIGAPTVATTTQTANLANATSLVANIPNPTVGAVNFLLLTAVSTGTGVNPNVTIPAGWTQLLSSWDSGSPSTALVVAWRTFQTGDPSTVTWTWTATGDAIATGASWPGVDPTTPVRAGEAAIQQQAASSTSFPTPSITLAGSTSWLAWAVAHRSAGTFTTPTAPDTQRAVAIMASSCAITLRDSGGTVASGAQSRTVVASATTSVGNEAIWALNPAASSGSAFSGAPSLTGSGAVTVAGAARTAGAPQITGSGAVTVAVTPRVTVTATLTGSGAVTLAAKVATSGTASLTGSGAVLAGTAGTGAATPAVTGSGTVTASVTPRTVATVALTGSGAVVVTGRPSVAAAVTLNGAGTVTASAMQTASSAATLTGAGTVLAGTAARVDTTATVTGSGSITTGSRPNPAAGVELGGIGTLTVPTLTQLTAMATANGVGTLTVIGVAGRARRDIDVTLAAVTSSPWALTSAAGTHWAAQVTGSHWSVETATGSTSVATVTGSPLAVASVTT